MHQVILNPGPITRPLPWYGFKGLQGIAAEIMRNHLQKDDPEGFKLAWDRGPSCFASQLEQCGALFCDASTKEPPEKMLTSQVKVQVGWLRLEDDCSWNMAMTMDCILDLGEVISFKI
jgi:hypothetical protein